jgi:hypothetical protein
MKTNDYNMQAIKEIVLSCKHTEKATKVAIESYISEHDRMYGENSIGELNMHVILDNHYDECTGELINDDWQTTVNVQVDDNGTDVSFN